MLFPEFFHQNILPDENDVVSLQRQYPPGLLTMLKSGGPFYFITV
jgi:hypothetical protein